MAAETLLEVMMFRRERALLAVGLEGEVTDGDAYRLQVTKKHGGHKAM